MTKDCLHGLLWHPSLYIPSVSSFVTQSLKLIQQLFLLAQESIIFLARRSILYAGLHSHHLCITSKEMISALHTIALYNSIYSSKHLFLSKYFSARLRHTEGAIGCSFNFIISLAIETTSPCLNSLPVCSDIFPGAPQLRDEPISNNLFMLRPSYN